MPAATQSFVPAKNGILTWNAIAQRATSVKYAAEIGSDDVTSLLSAGWSEIVTDIKKATMQWTIAVKKGEAALIDLGDELAASFVTTGGLGHTGIFIVLKMGEPKGGPKGGYMIDLEGQFQGVVTEAVGPTMP